MVVCFSLSVNAISFYQYPIPNNQWIRLFRKNIWNNVLHYISDKGLLRELNLQS
ncbi:hypothetical protein BACFRA24663_21365 [Bacteroides fragilis]